MTKPAISTLTNACAGSASSPSGGSRVSAPKAAEVLEGTEAEALAYSDFPYEHHVGLRTDNVQERTDASSSAAAAWCKTHLHRSFD